MLPFFCVTLTFAILLLSTPFIVSTTCDFDLSRWAYKLNLHHSLMKEPVVLCVGVVTVYNYVILGFLHDILQAYSAQNVASLKGRVRLDRFEQANKELRTLFPAFIVSAFLLYANTTRFDTLRNSFIILQTILLLLQPLASMCPRDSGLLSKYFYRSVLLWSLLYAILPHETNHVITTLTHFFHILITDPFIYIIIL